MPGTPINILHIFYLFILAGLGLCCSAGFSSGAVRGGYFSLWCLGFSAQWLLLS